MIFKVALIASLALVAFAQYGHGGYGGGHGGYGGYGGNDGGYGGGHGGYADDHAQPTPYHYGYDIAGDHGEFKQSRQESSDGHGNVKGSYSYVDDKGIQRQVDYVADHHGFRAEVKTNEPGTDKQDPADVHLEANPVVADHGYGGGYGGGQGGYGGGHGGYGGGYGGGHGYY